MNNLYGFFMEPQNFSVNDGDGIRTIVFFAGCPLRCKWCANPEGLVHVDRMSHRHELCIGCGKCTIICPTGVGNNLNLPEEREKCIFCGKCEDVCPAGSRRRLVKKYSVSEILKILERQEIFYRYSGGGVTFSGGEATLQQDVLRELAFVLYDRAISLAIETSGYFEFDDIKDILERLDLIFIDIKHMDDEKHRLYTGAGNEKILANIKRLNELNSDVVVRVPVIEGVNDSIDNIIKTARFVKESIKKPKIELLPYHSFGDEKYEVIGIEKPSREFKSPSRETLDKLAGLIRAEGVEIVSYK